MSNSKKNQLLPGQNLLVNEYLQSTNKLYRLNLQGDGNLVIYRADDVIWATNTVRAGTTQCSMQEDGNFVLYGAAGKILWASNTNETLQGASLILQDNGSLVIFLSKEKSKTISPIDPNLFNSKLYYSIINKKFNGPLDASSTAGSGYRNVSANSKSLNNDNQAWLIEAVPNSKNEFYLVNKKFNGYLDASSTTGSGYQNVAVSKRKLENPNQTWTFKPVPNSKTNEFYIVNKKFGGPLDASSTAGSGYGNVSANSKSLNNDNQTWAVEPIALKTTTTVNSMTYQDTQYPTKGLGKVDFISDQEIHNNGNVKITKTLSETLTKTSTFEWGLNEQLMLGYESKTEVEVPEVAKQSVSFQAQFTFGSEQTWTKTTQEEYKYEESIEIPANTNVKVSSYMDWAKDYTTPFVLVMRVKMDAQTKDGSKVALTAGQIESILQLKGCTGTISANDATSVLVTLNGKFTGSFGMKTYTEVTTIPSNS